MSLQEVFPTKPLIDDRKFYFGKLPNDLEVLIIEDQWLKKSQVGLGVNIGSMVNPKRLHGLAHLLEHMLFTGTDKYDSRHALSECLSKYQGWSNSKTGAREQIFNFAVTEDGLLECLDILGNFFIKPLLKQENIWREVNTVESEHLNNINT
jgi:secreted Zn-dependent insulinase-like peptidase